MSDGVKKILAYQQTPLVISCVESGAIPDDFLVSLTEDEQAYVAQRMRSPIEEVFYELLPALGAAGLAPTVHPLLCEVQRIPPCIHAKIDGISLSLVDQPGTTAYLKRDFVVPFAQALDEIMNKTQQRFDSSHLIVISALPRFYNDDLVTDDIITFGDDLIPGAVHEPEKFAALYESSIVRKYPIHTWLGINLRCFQTASLRQQLISKLKRVKAELLAKPE